MSDGLNRIAAIISAKSYIEPNHLNKNNQGYGELEGWKFLDAFSAVEDGGYFGLAFQAGNTIIIANRGTEIFDLDDLKNDLNIFFNKPLAQITSAIEFSTSILTKYSSHKILFTGHSLGALIAQILSLKFSLPAITFDSPGAYATAKSFFAKEIFDTSNITSFIASANFINTSGKQLKDQVIQIDYFSDPEGVSFLHYLKYSLAQHSIQNLVKEFNPLTDYPNKYQLHNSWISNLKGGFEAYLKNDALWKEKARLDWKKNKIIESYTDPETYEITEIKLHSQYKTLAEYEKSLKTTREEKLEKLKHSLLEEYLEIVKFLKVMFFDSEHSKPYKNQDEKLHDLIDIIAETLDEPDQPLSNFLNNEKLKRLLGPEFKEFGEKITKRMDKFVNKLEKFGDKIADFFQFDFTEEDATLFTNLYENSLPCCSSYSDDFTPDDCRQCSPHDEL